MSIKQKLIIRFWWGLDQKKNWLSLLSFSMYFILIRQLVLFIGFSNLGFVWGKMSQKQNSFHELCHIYISNISNINIPPATSWPGNPIHEATRSLNRDPATSHIGSPVILLINYTIWWCSYSWGIFPHSGGVRYAFQPSV